MRIPSLVRFLTACGGLALMFGLTAADDVVKEKPAEDGFVQLFNGKDLTGWKLLDVPSGNFKGTEKIEEGGKVIGYKGILKDGEEETLWIVKDGLIHGGGHASHLFTEKGGFTDFVFRCVAKVEDKSNSGMFFRAKVGPGFPDGYEAQMNATQGDPIKTGSLYPKGNLAKHKKEICVMDTAAHKPGEFFTEEVTCVGNKITIKVNGKVTVDFVDEDNTFKEGHFALQGHDPGSKMAFKTVEVKDLSKK